MNICGFVGKPETAKKTRGDQYFFVNNRFIKSAYLNHAVIGAFDSMIPKDSFPMYTLFIDLDPAQLDINVHPTKQEIKFEDEKIVYAFVQSAVKHSLAQFSISPTLDFELDSSIQKLGAVSQPFTEERKSSAASSSLYNTFSQKNQAHFIENKSELRHWRDLYETGPRVPNEDRPSGSTVEPGKAGGLHVENYQQLQDDAPLQQMHLTYIIVQNDAGFIVVHQQNAHERVLYERYIKALDGKPISIQQSLFPQTMELAAQDAVILNELLPDLHFLGYHLEPFGKHTFVIQGSPADVDQGNEKTSIEKMLEQYKHFSSDLRYSKRERLLRSLAWQQAIKPGRSLGQKEMRSLLQELFNCDMPNITPNGKPTFTAFKKNELDRMFGR
jgi:DNA mismatch repair protein MutL